MFAFLVEHIFLLVLRIILLDITLFIYLTSIKNDLLLSTYFACIEPEILLVIVSV
jgi:hypothetical protein